MTQTECRRVLRRYGLSGPDCSHNIMGEVIEVTAHYGRRCAVVVTPKMTAKQIEPLSSLLDRLAAFVVHLVEQQKQP